MSGSHRLIATFTLCAAASACDTFAQAPNESGQPASARAVPQPIEVTPPAGPPPTAPQSVTIAPPVTSLLPQPPAAVNPVANNLPLCPPFTSGPSNPAPEQTDAGQNPPEGDAGLPFEAEDAATPRLPSGDTVLVDDLTLLVIFDNSGSMAECWDGKTRWEHAIDALRAAIEPAQHSLRVGAIRFPGDGQCAVAPFSSSRQFAFGLGHEFLAEWDARVAYPTGGTPLAAAMVEANKAIQDAAAAGLLEERFRVVILTDGEPNCDGSLSLLTALPAAWRTLGVETYVLGLPGSHSAATLLQSIADAGGGLYEQLTTPGELRESAEHAAR